MRYMALATDYDETLADEGRVLEEVIEALQRLRKSGRRLLMVTGRELDDLRAVFDRLDLFDYVVAENGALLYQPATNQETPLADPPDERLVRILQQKQVTPLSVGRVIVATREPYETDVLQAIHELGLELQVIFNKGAVMVLPSGVNKATGLRAALDALGLSPHNVVAIGDAENDHAFLRACEAGVAVANALPTLQEQSDLVTRQHAGRGVAELIDALLTDDLLSLAPRLERYRVLVGTTAEGSEVRLEPCGTTILVAGTSGSGKSTLVTGLLERFAEQGYEFCLIDPEGDYTGFAGAVVLGDNTNSPTVEEVLQVIARPRENVVVNLLGIPLADRPEFFETLQLRIQDMRARTGRPHWIVVDEAHHMMPPDWQPAGLSLPEVIEGVVLITVHPEMVAQPVLAHVNTLIAVGEDIPSTLGALGKALGVPVPDVPKELESGEAIVWSPRHDPDPVRVRTQEPQSERRRHERKYAEGELGPERSFYFRGPDGRLNLRAQNLMIFMQLADGLDEETWRYHLGRGDYSRWFRDMIKDAELATEAKAVEREDGLSFAETRARIRAAIESRYTLPDVTPSGSSDAAPE